MSNSQKYTPEHAHDLLQAYRKESNALKTHVSAVLHNQLGSSLTSILLQLQVFIDQTESEKNKKSLEEIRENIRNCYDISSTLHKNLKNDSISQEPSEFFSWINQKMPQLESHFPISIQLQSQADQWSIDLPFLLNTTLVQLSKQYFNDSIERVSDHIEIAMTNKDNIISLTAKDNGVDISRSEASYQHLKKRITLMKGEFEILHQDNRNQMQLKIGYLNE
ncbi:MAG: hypothetical protein KDD52_06630 [Bdellovibrionales bacterium]|nr:hypothetical protein [Bdellovibrionales bacterium]